MDNFLFKIYETLYDHFVAELEPPLSSHQEFDEFEDNLKELIQNSGLKSDDDADTIWQKLADNKHKYPYFTNITFIDDD